MIAYKGRAIGVSAYVGDSPSNYSGQFSRVIANAGAWLSPPCPTPTPSTVSVSGSVTYCSNPSLNPVPNVVMTVTGTSGAVTSTNGLGNYSFSLSSGGSYTVTPTKATLVSGSAGINTVDVIAMQGHALGRPPLLTGCRLTAADVDQNGSINTVDVIAVQAFALGRTSGFANTGKYQFSPVSRSYPGVASNQTAQNYDALVLGDIATTFVHRPEGVLPERDR